jgi:hypothetical protein
VKMKDMHINFSSFSLCRDGVTQWLYLFIFYPFATMAGAIAAAEAAEAGSKSDDLASVEDTSSQDELCEWNLTAHTMSR